MIIDKDITQTVNDSIKAINEIRKLNKEIYDLNENVEVKEEKLKFLYGELADNIRALSCAI